MQEKEIRIIFFIGNLATGGKERRMLELLTYLKSKGNYNILVLLTKDKIHYPYFNTLGIPYRVIHRKFRHDYISRFFIFFQTCKKFKPDLIHTWGRVQSFYTLPTVVTMKIPLVNSQITSAPPTVNKMGLPYFLDKLIYRFSKIILANSLAGLSTFKPPQYKSKVIYNGLNPSRFVDIPTQAVMKAKYKIHTPYAVVMTANISSNKDHAYFFALADIITKQRADITFVSVGAYEKKDPQYLKYANITATNPLIILTGRINEVEALVNACDIGVLFSPCGEGISNAILEYMALGKPVIANDIGGTREIIRDNKNGYLIKDHSVNDTANLITNLIDNKAKLGSFGEESKNIVAETFSLDKMGNAFVKVYNEILSSK